MRTILLSSLVIIFLGGCNITGGMGRVVLSTNGCGNNCTSEDYYLPGRGVWANDKPIDKSRLVHLVEQYLVYVMTHSSGDPLISTAVAGMLVGHEVGATFDKIDQMYATMLLAQSLTLNEDMQSSTWKTLQKKCCSERYACNNRG